MRIRELAKWVIINGTASQSSKQKYENNISETDVEITKT